MANNDGVHVKINKFKCKKKLVKNPTICIIGKRNSGKSVIIGDLLYYLSKQKVPRACVFSATEESSSNAFFSNHIPDSFIFSHCDLEDRLTKLCKNQEALKMNKKIGLIPSETDLRVVVVLDDIGFERKILNCPIVNEIFMNGRHHEITLILTLQNIMQLSPKMRSNCDFTFCLKEDNQLQIKNLYENYFGSFKKKSHFEVAFNACTENFGCIVKDGSTGTPPENVICWYKAKHGRKFKFGSKDFWKYHDDRYLTKVDRYLLSKKKKDDKEESCVKPGTIIVSKGK